MNKGTITLELDGLSPETILRIKETIDSMFMAGAFGIRNGSVELHFDNDGVLKKISHNTQWLRDKPTPEIQRIKVPVVKLL